MPGAARRKTIEGMVCRFIGLIDSLQEPSYITCVFKCRPASTSPWQIVTEKRRLASFAL
jgi:hypothetical protein